MRRFFPVVCVTLFASATLVVPAANAGPLTEEEAQRQLEQLENSLLQRIDQDETAKPGTDAAPQRPEPIPAPPAGDVLTDEVAPAEPQIRPAKNADIPPGMVAIPDSLPVQADGHDDTEAMREEIRSALKATEIETTQGTVPAIVVKADEPPRVEPARKIPGSAKSEPPPPAEEPAPAKVEQAKSENASGVELASLRKKVAELTSQLQQTRSEIQRLNRERDESRRKLDMAEVEVAELTAALQQRGSLATTYGPARGKLGEEPRVAVAPRQVREPAPPQQPTRRVVKPVERSGRIDLVKIARDGVQLRLEPNSGGELAGITLRKNQEVAVNQRVDGWLQVRADEGLGWVPSTAVEYPGKGGAFDRESSYKNRGYDPDFDSDVDAAAERLKTRGQGSGK